MNSRMVHCLLLSVLAVPIPAEEEGDETMRKAISDSLRGLVNRVVENGGEVSLERIGTGGAEAEPHHGSVRILPEPEEQGRVSLRIKVEGAQGDLQRSQTLLLRKQEEIVRRLRGISLTGQSTGKRVAGLDAGVGETNRGIAGLGAGVEGVGADVAEDLGETREISVTVGENEAILKRIEKSLSELQTAVEALASRQEEMAEEDAGRNGGKAYTEPEDATETEESVEEEGE